MLIEPPGSWGGVWTPGVGAGGVRFRRLRAQCSLSRCKVCTACPTTQHARLPASLGPYPAPMPPWRPRQRPIVRLADFGSVWAELFPAEQARIMRVLIERVDVQADGLEVGLASSGGGAAAVARRSGRQPGAMHAESRLEGGTLVGRIPMRLGRQRGRKRTDNAMSGGYSDRGRDREIGRADQRWRRERCWRQTFSTRREPFLGRVTTSGEPVC